MVYIRIIINLLLDNMEIKRLFAWALIAMPLLAACDDDKINNEENGGDSTEVTMATLTGEWYLHLPESSETIDESLVINKDGTFVMQRTYSSEGQVSFENHSEGKFKLEGNKLIGQNIKSQYRYSIWDNGQYKGMSEWQDDDYSQMADTIQVSLIRGGSVLLLFTSYDEGATFYFKKGSKLPADKSELQGTWYWMEESYKSDDRAVRVAVKFDGDNIDLIVCPWNQRFICKYTYKDGIVSSSGEVTFRTLWRADGANELNPTNPYDSDWLPTYDPEQYTGNLSDGFSFPFIVNGKNAYSIFVGLNPVYTKQ